MRLAVIDIGTNTFHLLIAEGIDKILYKATVPVFLGQGMINQHMIIPEAMERGIRTLTQFRSIIDSYQVDVIKAVATSAVRSADNRYEFVGKAAAIGINIEVITGEAEAEYIFNGVMATGLIRQTTLVMDIGGGSTEFIICHPQGALWKKSYNIGAARLMQAYFHSDPMSEKEHQDIVNHLDNTLDELKTACAQYKPSLLVGSAGAFESFAALLNDGNEIGDVPSANLDIEKYKAISKRLIASTHAERASMKGLISLRVDMIVIAAIITDYVLERLNLQQLSLSAYDLKMGVLATTIKWHTLKNEAVQLATTFDPADSSSIEKDATRLTAYIDALIELGADPLQLVDHKFTLFHYISTFATDEKVIAKYKSLALATARKSIDEYLTDHVYGFQADIFLSQAIQIGRLALQENDDKDQLDAAIADMRRVAPLAGWNEHAHFKSIYARLLLKSGRVEEAYKIISAAPASAAALNDLKENYQIRNIVAARKQAYERKQQDLGKFKYPAHPLVRANAEEIITIRARMMDIEPRYAFKTYTPAEIEVFEQQSGMMLPDEYKVYLMEIGSGGKDVFFTKDIPGLEEISSEDKEKIFIGVSIQETEVFLLKNGEVWTDFSPWEFVSEVQFVPATHPTLNFLAFIAGSLNFRNGLTLDSWL